MRGGLPVPPRPEFDWELGIDEAREITGAPAATPAFTDEDRASMWEQIAALPLAPPEASDRATVARTVVNGAGSS